MSDLIWAGLWFCATAAGVFTGLAVAQVARADVGIFAGAAVWFVLWFALGVVRFVLPEALKEVHHAERA